MLPLRLARAVSLVLVVLTAGCVAGDSAAPTQRLAAAIAPLSDLSRSVRAGTSVDGGLAVKVVDAEGRAVRGVAVAFIVTAGNGSTNPRLAVTDDNGQAATTWTAGTISGPNEVTASVEGVADIVTFAATGTAGSAASISLSTRRARLLADVESLQLNVRTLDAFGNTTAPAPTFIVRDPSLVTVDPNGLIHALRRGASTYVIASADALIDSVFVTVLAPGQSICTAVAEPMAIAVGQVITDVSSEGFCVHGTSANTEYALVPFYDAPTPNSAIEIQARGEGITTVTTAAPLASLARIGAGARLPLAPSIIPDYAREARMREQERREAMRRVPALRAGIASSIASATRAPAGAARRTITGANAATTTPLVGDIVKLNANATDFCENPVLRVGRVAAVTDRAIVIADTANPSGGFSNDEYRSIGVTFDTLVDPTDRRMFGDPSDIDGNGRVIMFFTRAVNELTSANSSSVYLGFYYQRDLFPKNSGAGTCEGSNVGEMFYLMVPDPAGTVNGNVRRKEDVVEFTLGTVAHEYQHLINASRRMYVNRYGSVFEEKWLDEGLAHVAEDLNFWVSSGRSPRSNLDNSLFGDPRAATAYSTFMAFNQSRYRQYLGTPETQGPIGSTDTDDDLYTRGAVWNFLRYAADRLGAEAEPRFWFDLVNNNAKGLANLSNALGTSPGPWLRDWAISNYVDDNAAGSDARFVQPSFNFRSIMTKGGTGPAYPLDTRSLRTTGPTSISLAAYGVAFLRFAVPEGQDALLTVTTLGQSLPSSVQLAIVRVR